MSSPESAGSGIGHAAGELLEEMKKAQAEIQQLEKQNKTQAPNEAFQQAMQAQQQTGTTAHQAYQASTQAQQSQQVVSDASVEKILKQARSSTQLSTTRVGATEREASVKLMNMFQHLLTGQDKMTHIINMALSGFQFSPTELLAMQAGVYRFTQELDLTSKVVEKGTGSIKQTLNTQV